MRYRIVKGLCLLGAGGLRAALVKARSDMWMKLWAGDQWVKHVRICCRVTYEYCNGFKKHNWLDHF